MALENVTPATRLLEKRRQMFEVQEALEHQKAEFERKVVPVRMWGHVPGQTVAPHGCTQLDARFWAVPQAHHATRPLLHALAAPPPDARSTLTVTTPRTPPPVQEELFRRREEGLKKKDLDLQENLIKFSKFLQDNDSKRARADKKAAEEVRGRLAREREIEQLTDALEQLREEKEHIHEVLGGYMRCAVPQALEPDRRWVGIPLHAPAALWLRRLQRALPGPSHQLERGACAPVVASCSPQQRRQCC